MKWFRSTSSAFALIILLSTVILSVNCGEEAARSKRSYYGGYDMYNDDFWYVGRIIGMIVGLCILLCCCCLPCVCIAGIWFAGWFGLRQRRQKTAGQVVSSNPAPIQVQQAPAVPVYPPVSNTNNYDYNTPGNANYIPSSSNIRQQQQIPQTRHVHVESSPRDSEISRVMIPGDQVIFSAEDRYYTSSTAPAAAHRPDAYISSSTRY